MLVSVRRATTRALLVSAAALLLALPAAAAPLGLSVGDVVTSIEWGGGAMYTNGNQNMNIDAQVQSVEIAGPSTILQNNVDIDADLTFLSEVITPIAGPLYFVNVVLGSPGNNPDLVIKENGINILIANFTTSVIAQGLLNVADANPVFSAVGTITTIGGDANLLAALGGVGGQANLLLSASIFDFNPNAAVLIGDNQIFNSDFNVTLSGTLIPLASSPFVPEPSTALLFGGGLLGLLGMARRTNRRD